MPSEIILFAAGITWDIMNNLIKHSEFHSIKNHLYILHKISCIKLGRQDDVILFEECMCKGHITAKTGNCLSFK